MTPVTLPVLDVAAEQREDVLPEQQSAKKEDRSESQPQRKDSASLSEIVREHRAFLNEARRGLELPPWVASKDVSSKK